MHSRNNKKDNKEKEYDSEFFRPICIYKPGGSKDNKEKEYDSEFFRPICIYKPGGSKDNKEKEYDSDANKPNCYLTTACTASIGLPENCLELTTLRAFRDKILLPSSIGKKAVKEYYHLAPEIVAAVNASENPKRVWERVYSDISTAVMLVRRGKFNEAFEHYKGMTNALKEKYLN